MRGRRSDDPRSSDACVVAAGNELHTSALFAWDWRQCVTRIASDHPRYSEGQRWSRS